MRSGVGGRCEGGVECCFVDGSEERAGRAVGIDDDEGRLAGDREPCVDVAGIVADLGEGEAVSGDEVVDCVVVACPCDSDKFNVTVPLLVGRFDRSGFLVTGASSGRPEPQHSGPPGD